VVPDAGGDAAFFLTEVAIRTHWTDEFELRHGIQSTKAAPSIIEPTSAGAATPDGWVLAFIP
jgi:hypothetical protein